MAPPPRFNAPAVTVPLASCNTPLKFPKVKVPLLIVNPLLAVKVEATVRVPAAVKLAPAAVSAVVPAEDKTILPVVAPPSVKVFLLSAWIDPSPPSTKPVPPVICDEIEATGVREPALFRKANFALAVEFAPSNRSIVVLYGASAPLFCCK